MISHWLRSLAPSGFLLFAVLLVVTASATALLVVYDTGERIITERERAEVLADRDLLQEVGREQGRAVLISSVARRSRFAAEGARYGLFDHAGRFVAGDLTSLDGAPRESDWRLTSVSAPAPTKLHLLVSALPDGWWLAIGRDLGNLRRFERSILFGFFAAVVIVAGVGLAAGLVLNGLILQRVEAIAATAERIAAGDLSARTAISDRRDPFGRVGASLNAMLERIEELLTGMRTVTDSLAHDLRSPLTRMKSALARALQEGSTEAERLDAIEAAHREAEQTLATLTALLDIARAETGLSRQMMRPVDVAALVEEVADFFDPMLEDAGQSLTCVAPQEPVPALGHEALLRQAVGNLLHNAANYAGEGAQVTATVERIGALARITVADTGVGVPADQRGRVQERFVRLDTARPAGGSGLGLAIVAACAKLHGGALRLEDNEPGLRAVLELNLHE